VRDKRQTKINIRERGSVSQKKKRAQQGGINDVLTMNHAGGNTRVVAKRSRVDSGRWMTSGAQHYGCREGEKGGLGKKKSKQAPWGGLDPN